MRQWTVDAFASAPFRGNPACVVEPFDAWPSDDWMQALAKENNQAETAFLLCTADPARFGLRWFTPGREVDLCGHATLGSAHVLMAELGLDASALTFDSRSGPLIVRRAGRMADRGPVVIAEAEARATAAFARLDADQDGFVTAAERQATRAGRREHRRERMAERRAARRAQQASPPAPASE